jgi:hypothetical protein
MMNILYFLFDSFYNVAIRYFKPTKPVLLIKKKPIPPDPIIEFVKRRQDRLMRTYDNKTEMSANIDPIFYDKAKFAEAMRTENNYLEQKWKKCLLYESTPRGNIFMYYDVYKSGFGYYSDQNCVPYAILNAMAMRYVVVFFCRDFFMDESIITELSKLRDVSDTKPKPKSDNNNTQMAKLKKYKTSDDTPVTIRNKFISLGKPYNLEIIQKKSKIPTLNVKGPTKYDAVFKLSYKDFKAASAAAAP